jgi:uncharacterized Zn-finger protein
MSNNKISFNNDSCDINLSENAVKNQKNTALLSGFNHKHKRVKCSGEDTGSQHPAIYIDVKENQIATCSYCGKKFKY